MLRKIEENYFLNPVTGDRQIVYNAIVKSSSKAMMYFTFLKINGWKQHPEWFTKSVFQHACGQMTEMNQIIKE